MTIQIIDFCIPYESIDHVVALHDQVLLDEGDSAGYATTSDQ